MSANIKSIEKNLVMNFTNNISINKHFSKDLKRVSIHAWGVDIFWNHRLALNILKNKNMKTSSQQEKNMTGSNNNNIVTGTSFPFRTACFIFACTKNSLLE